MPMANPRRPAPDDDGHRLQPGREVQPGAGAEQNLGGDDDREALGERGDDGARGGRRQSREHQRAGAEAAEERAADEVGDGDRQRQQPERQTRLALGHAELGGDLRHHRRQRLLADGHPEVGEADEGEGAPPASPSSASPHEAVAARRCDRSRRASEPSRILYAIRVAP